MANMFPRNWDIVLLMMHWAVLAGPYDKAPGLFETSALNHNLLHALLCQESCHKNQHLTHLLLVLGNKLLQLSKVQCVRVQQQEEKMLMVGGKGALQKGRALSVVHLFLHSPGSAGAHEPCSHNGVKSLPLKRTQDTFLQVPMTAPFIKPCPQ